MNQPTDKMNKMNEEKLIKSYSHLKMKTVPALTPTQCQFTLKNVEQGKFGTCCLTALIKQLLRKNGRKFSSNLNLKQSSSHIAVSLFSFPSKKFEEIKMNLQLPFESDAEVPYGICGRNGQMTVFTFIEKALAIKIGNYHLIEQSKPDQTAYALTGRGLRSFSLSSYTSQKTLELLRSMSQNFALIVVYEGEHGPVYNGANEHHSYELLGIKNTRTGLFHVTLENPWHGEVREDDSTAYVTRNRNNGVTTYEFSVFLKTYSRCYYLNLQ